MESNVIHILLLSERQFNINQRVLLGGEDGIKIYIIFSLIVSETAHSDCNVVFHYVQFYTIVIIYELRIKMDPIHQL